jgi:hypothetical protein
MALITRRLLASAGIVTFSLGLAAWRARPPGPDRPMAFLVMNGTLVLVGAVLLGAAALRSRTGRSGPQSPSAPEPARPAPAGYPVLGIALGTSLAALGPHLVLVFCGAILTAWSAWRLSPPTPGQTIPAGPALTLLLLPTYWLLGTIAGPVGLAMPSLSDVPLSPAAERLFSAALLLVAWGMSGLPPFHRRMAGAFSAPAAAILLARVGMDAAPEGLGYWRTIVFPVLVAALWYAALRKRPELVAAAGGFLGLLSLDPDGLVGGYLLLAAAILLEVGSRTGEDRWWIRAPLVFLAALGGIEALTGTLRVEVVYSVLAVIGAGVALVTAGRISSGIFGATRDK